MKTAISVPDVTFERVDRAAKKIGVSRSEFYARAAERWLDQLESDGVTAAIDAAVAGASAPDSEFLARAAAQHARDEW